PSDERAVQRRADARIGLCAGHDEPPDPEARQHGLEGGVLKGVAVALLHQRLGIARSQFGDDPPVVASLRELLVGMLDPDNGDLFPPRLLDQAADVRDNRVALVSAPDDTVLHVDDEECGVRPVLQCGHSLPLLTPGCCLPDTLAPPTDSSRCALRNGCVMLVNSCEGPTSSGCIGGGPMASD